MLALFVWFSIGFLVYFLNFGLSFIDALKATFFYKLVENDFSSGYLMWSQGIIFGVIFTFLFDNIIKKYNPERGCRLMAKEMKDHLIIIGYSHLGERLVSYLREKKFPYCLIEKDSERVDELLRAGEPVIIDDAKEEDALEDAGIRRAKSVIITANDLETAMLVTKRAREINKNCVIIARCFQDEFVEVIESLGANKIISSSKEAFENIIGILRKGKYLHH